MPFNNNGLVTAKAGDLSFDAGGTMSSTSVVNAANGTSVLFSNNYTLQTGSQLIGAGAFTQTGGTLTVDGTLTASAFNWSGGNWNAPTTGLTTTIAASTVFNLGNAANHDFNQRAIVNNGTVNWTSGYIRSGNGGSFTNAVSGTFNDTQTTGYAFNNASLGGAFTITNNGTYVRNGASTTFFQMPFNNNGLITAKAGDLSFDAGGTMSSTSVVNAANGTSVLFTNNYTLQTGSQLLGAGTFTQTGGTLTVDGTLTASVFNWSGGNWNAPTTGLTTTIAASTLLNLGNAANHDFNQRAIVNEGTINWTSGYIRSGNGGSFFNAVGGTFNDNQASGYAFNNASLGGAFTITNNGVYNKLGASTTTVSQPFINNNGAIFVSAGTLQFSSTFQQTAGTLNLSNGGTLQFDNGLNLAAGALSGSGTVIGNVSSSGLISPGNPLGTLNISGTLSLQPTSVLLLQIGGTASGGSYDLLSVSGTTALGGTLQLAFANGFAAAVQPTNTFSLITAASFTGTFSNAPVSGPWILATTDGLGSFQVNFSGTALTLSNFTAIPEPAAIWTAVLVGFVTAVAIGRRRRDRNGDGRGQARATLNA